MGNPVNTSRGSSGPEATPGGAGRSSSLRRIAMLHRRRQGRVGASYPYGHLGRNPVHDHDGDPEHGEDYRPLRCDYLEQPKAPHLRTSFNLVQLSDRVEED